MKACMSADMVSNFVDHVLFSPDPLAHTRVVIPVTLGALSLTDIDLMSSPLDSLLSRGIPSLDGHASSMDPVSLLGTYHRDGSRRGKSSASRNGTGSLISMKKSLFLSEERLGATARQQQTQVQPQAQGRGTLQGRQERNTIVAGTKMIRCHPWRAMSLAQELMHTELRLPHAAPLMVIENAQIALSADKRDRLVPPSHPDYEPGEMDIRLLSKAFDVPVRLIRHKKIAFDSNALGPKKGTDSPVMVLAWTDTGSWYVILADNQRLLWTESAANKIQSRIQ